MKYFKLNDGNRIPANGFGTFQIPGNYECAEIVTNAIESGYRLIDTAEIYHNESMVGKGIKNSSVPRDQLFITSKIWINNAGYYKTKLAIENSLQKLDLEYLDLLLIHQPFGDYYGSWRAMEEARQSGKIKSIGVSNFPIHNLIDLKYFNSIEPVIDQIEINPWRQEFNTVHDLKKLKTQPEAWAPLAEGRNHIFSNPLLKNLSNKYNKSIAQIILRWEFQRGIVSLVKSTHLSFIEENLNIYDFNLEASDMDQIKTLNQNHGSVEDLCGNLLSDDSKDIAQYASYARQLSRFI